MVHEYLGMDLNHINKGVVNLPMIKYLNIALKEFTEHLGSAEATPSTNHLFKVHEESEARYISEKQVKIYIPHYVETAVHEGPVTLAHTPNGGFTYYAHK